MNWGRMGKKCLWPYRGSVTVWQEELRKITKISQYSWIPPCNLNLAPSENKCRTAVNAKPKPLHTCVLLID